MVSARAGRLLSNGHAGTRASLCCSLLLQPDFTKCTAISRLGHSKAPQWCTGRHGWSMLASHSSSSHSCSYMKSLESYRQMRCKHLTAAMKPCSLLQGLAYQIAAKIARCHLADACFVQSLGLAEVGQCPVWQIHITFCLCACGAQRKG